MKKESHWLVLVDLEKTIYPILTEQNGYNLVR